MMRIDAHQHFWQYDPIKHGWINDKMRILKRDFLPADLAPILKDNSIDGCIAVQADQSEEETDFLIDLAEKNDFIKGVVGWIDLRSAHLESRLIHYSKYYKLKGWRHVVQDEVDLNFILRDDFLRGISLLEQFDYTYDILIYPRQLSASIEMVKMFPNQKFVIDHIAKPNIKERCIEKWKEYMCELGKLENVWCKVSGMVTEASWTSWAQEHFDPYLKVVFNSFGHDKVMFGSDWPVSLLAASYDNVTDILTNYLLKATEEQRLKFWSKNAIDFYDLT